MILRAPDDGCVAPDRRELRARAGIGCREVRRGRGIGIRRPTAYSNAGRQMATAAIGGACPIFLPFPDVRWAEYSEPGPAVVGMPS
jgi:hypothetical protein